MLSPSGNSQSRFGSDLVIAMLATGLLACAEDERAGSATDTVAPNGSADGNQEPSATTEDGSSGSSGGNGGTGGEVEPVGSEAPAPTSAAGGSSASTIEEADAGSFGGDGDDVRSEAGDDAGTEAPHQFKIEFDYRLDSSGYFTPERRELLEYAGSIWASVIHDDFEEIPAGTPIRLNNIQDLEGDPIELVLEEPIDDLRLYVNCSDQLDESVAGNTMAIALLPDLWGEDFKERLRERFIGSDHEPWAVAVTFNCNVPFYFDQSPETVDDLPGDAPDFLSTALHEIGHALGLGISITFDNLRSGDEFLGENAMDLFGGPVPMVPGSGHVVEGTLIDGGRVLMDLSRERGTRDLPSALDLAMLADIGYEVAE